MACSLDADALKTRLERLAELGRRSLLGHESDGGGQTLRFRDDPWTQAALEEAVSAERECCPFLTLSIGRGEGELKLVIDAPGGGEPIAAELAAALQAAAG